MIIYVTGRPDMQKHRVVAWLSQHNFPHGAVSFCDGLTHDPLRQKAAFLQSLRTEAEITIVAATAPPRTFPSTAPWGWHRRTSTSWAGPSRSSTTSASSSPRAT
eukprot:XP_027314829.1 membrane-associated phosphatidylinositol transfer protein 1-like [Anas platyrhynchos]